MNKQTINSILKITESYQLPDRLMELIFQEDVEQLFDAFLTVEHDLNYDWFTDYFQEEHGDRKTLKQDFTPKCVQKIVNGVVDKADSFADICAGTGGLTISAWSNNHDAFFHCEELSSRAVPLLLFNLAIRGINGEVVHGDVLSGDHKAVYEIEKNGKYSHIQAKESTKDRKYKRVIMNPPYSISWNGEEKEEYAKYGFPPKSKADYCFVLHGLNILEDGGILAAVLPHGVLFRGQGEGVIRKNLIKNNMLRSIIGLPDKLFLNTSIPVCVMVLEHAEEGALIVDGSKEYVRGSKQNDMSEQNINTVLSAYRIRKNIEKLSHLASLEEIEENEYNLNIPRYVDNFDKQEIPDLPGMLDEMVKLDKEIKMTTMELHEMIKNLVGTDEESEKAIRLIEDAFGQIALDI